MARKPEATPITSMTKCPNEHALPHNTEWGQCTPIGCAEDRAPPSHSPEQRAMTARRAPPESVEVAAAKTMAKNEALRRLRHEKLDVPSGLEGADAEKYVETKLTKLLPAAAAEYEYRLNYGNDNERWDAAKEVMAAKGFGRKEAGSGSVSPIMLIQITDGGGVLVAPWDRNKAQKPAEPKIVGSGAMQESTHA